MKTVKSLLLGSAAGLVAVAGAQAADLPVKAKPVEYVKVCSIYGAGFYYIPGTDTCLKIGGFARADINFHGQENDNTYRSGGPGGNTREGTANYNTRYRGIVSFDARSQTEWGTLRSYIRAGWELNSGSVLSSGASGNTGSTSGLDNGYRGNTYFDRAFIQFAGFTVGKTQGFFDFYANALNYTTSIVGGSDTGHGINLLAYTAQFAGGFSGTISLEDGAHRRTGLWDASTNGLQISGLAGAAASASGSTTSIAAGGSSVFLGGGTGAAAGSPSPNYGNYAAQRFPDIVGNLRVDQPWGSAQIMGALHDVAGSCYGATCNPVFIDGRLPGQAGTAALIDPTGNPGSKLGYAAGAGVQFNLPWAKGDQLWLQATYARGAMSYLGFNNFVTNSVFQVFSDKAAGTPSAAGVPGAAGSGGLRQGSLFAGWAFDGIFQNGTGVALTDGFQANAAIQHFWTPSLRSSVFGGYSEVHFDTQARALFCTGLPGTVVVPGARNQNTGAVINPGVCNPDFNVAQVGTRTIWSPVKDLDIGVEVLYTRWGTHFAGDFSVASTASRPAGAYRASSQDTVSALLRFQRNFVP